MLTLLEPPLMRAQSACVEEMLQAVARSGALRQAIAAAYLRGYHAGREVGDEHVEVGTNKVGETR